MRKRSRTPIGGFTFGMALNVACFLPGAIYYAPVLIGVGWFFGVVWSLLNLAQSLRARDPWGIAFGAVGIVLCFTPSLWLTGYSRSAQQSTAPDAALHVLALTKRSRAAQVSWAAGRSAVLFPQALIHLGTLVPNLREIWSF